ncbi:MAG: c-type cytochrome biogenesis protein CcmI, partial [Pseudorhodobacter sp.]|nr:c-type cytochrome biogenesis protein CcmI [Rhizobacter sp.]
MTVFWIFAAGLVVLALCLVLPSLWRKPAFSTMAADASQANLEILRAQVSQLDADLANGSLDADQHLAARTEISRRVLDEEAVTEAPRVVGASKKTALTLAVFVPVFALAGYSFLGNFEAISAQTVAASAEGEVTQAEITAMVDTLALRMKENPGDPVGWTMLANAYSALQRFPEADQAYRKATALSPKNAQLFADHADVLAMIQGRSAAGEPLKLIEQALAIDPDNLKALALAGSAAFERKDFPAALGYWGKARKLAPEGEFANSLDASIAEIKQTAPGAVAMGLPAGPTAAPAIEPAVQSVQSAPSLPSMAAANASAAANSAAITGTVSLAPALLARAAPTDTVFIFARAAQGPRMPLAIVKKQVSDLPFNFKLDDSTAMSPQMKLSNFADVVVGARISKS